MTEKAMHLLAGLTLIIVIFLLYQYNKINKLQDDKKVLEVKLTELSSYIQQVEPYLPR